IHVVVRVHVLVGAEASAQDLVRAVGEDLVHVHVKADAGAGVEYIDNELIHVLSGEDLIARREDGVLAPFVETPGLAARKRGGPQGSGINASAEVFAKACSRAGLRVYANIEYHSNIMGKHSFYRVRVDDEDVRSYKDKADILVALDLETLAGDGDHRRWATHYGHLAEINDGGGVIFDNEIGFDPATANRPDLRFYAVPFMDIIKKALEEVGK